MKNKLLIFLITIMMFVTACGKKEDNQQGVPQVEKIRDICELATVECYYHNVAKSEKEAGSGISHIGEVDRKFWIEYSGTAKIGIDMSLVDLSIKGDIIYVTMPDAKVLSMNPDKDALNEDSYISTQDSWFNHNKISADDQTAAISEAELKMKYSLESNKTLMNDAKERAEELIKNYINEVSSISDMKYTIIFTDLNKYEINIQADDEDNAK